ncbi:MAG: hypothetical protein PGN23_12830 [Sphingomonas adhaesiva]|uniref:hypothetical protein n=1 Tax=Sphingomonas adhaesiva TaxID=28212 RepID=UPI002FFB7EA9
MRTEGRRRLVRARVAAVAILLTSYAVQAAPTGQKGSASRRHDTVDVAEAKSIIRASLIDPASAQFEVGQTRSALAEDGTKTPLICGSYNAKNRFGGYVGKAFFAYSKSARAVFTSNVARLDANGGSVSLAALGNSLRGTPSMDQINAVQTQGTELQKQVKFWLGQCEG